WRFWYFPVLQSFLCTFFLILSVFNQCEQFRSFRRHKNRMFLLGDETAVFSLKRPVILAVGNERCIGGDERLNCYDHALFQKVMVCRIEIVHDMLRCIMQAFPNTVARKVLY